MFSHEYKHVWQVFITAEVVPKPLSVHNNTLIFKEPLRCFSAFSPKSYSDISVTDF